MRLEDPRDKQYSWHYVFFLKSWPVTVVCPSSGTPWGPRSALRVPLIMGHGLCTHIDPEMVDSPLFREKVQDADPTQQPCLLSIQPFRKYVLTLNIYQTKSSRWSYNAKMQSWVLPSSSLQICGSQKMSQTEGSLVQTHSECRKMESWRGDLGILKWLEMYPEERHCLKLAWFGFLQ